MKKFSIGLLLFFAVFVSFTFAQEGVKDISLKFCNDGTWDNLSTKYTIMIEPWQQQELCIYVENKSSNDVIMKYSFPKASFSPGWNQICDNTNDFAKFLIDNPKRDLVISWNSSVTIKEVVSAPLGMIGMYYGCLAYQLEKPEVEWMGWMFNIIVRKAVYLNLFVGGENNISNLIQLIPATGDIFSTNKNISANYNDDGDLILKFSVKNNWNLTQNVSLSGKLYNPLGFERPFNVPIKKLLPGDIYPVSVNLWIVPFYKWLFSVRATLTGEPFFEFDSSWIDDKYKQTTIIKETWSLFIFSWLYVILAIVIIWLIIKIIIPKKKKAE